LDLGPSWTQNPIFNELDLTVGDLDVQHYTGLGLNSLSVLCWTEKFEPEKQIIAFNII